MVGFAFMGGCCVVPSLRFPARIDAKGVNLLRVVLSYLPANFRVLWAFFRRDGIENQNSLPAAIDDQKAGGVGQVVQPEAPALDIFNSISRFQTGVRCGAGADSSGDFTVRRDDCAFP